MRTFAFAAAFLLFVPAASASPCADAWKAEEHGAKWEVARVKWPAFCAQAASPEQALEKARTVFIEACLDQTLASVQAGYYHHHDVLKLCKDGLPGRAKLHRTTDVPRPKAPGPKPDGLRLSEGRIQEIEKTIGIQLKAGELAALYGERAAGRDSGAVGGGRPGAPPAVGFPAKPRGAGLDGRVPPAPATTAQRAANIKALSDLVVATGASETSLRQARKVLALMLADADPAVVQNLVDHKVHVYVIPKDKSLVDLEPFKKLKGKKTFDGRVWDKVRGVGNTRLPDGKGSAMAVSEESLLVDHRLGEGYPKNFVMAHEFGHMVQIHGLPTRAAPAPLQPGIMARLSEAWNAFAKISDDPVNPDAVLRARTLGRVAFAAAAKPPSFAETFELYRRNVRREGKSTLGAYADTNEKEFFAELTAAYFDVGFEKGKPNDLKKLIAERPELADMMYRIYGPARSLRGK